MQVSFFRTKKGCQNGIRLILMRICWIYHYLKSVIFKGSMNKQNNMIKCLNRQELQKNDQPIPSNPALAGLKKLGKPKEQKNTLQKSLEF